MKLNGKKIMVAALMASSFFSLIGCQGTRPTNIGAKDGVLTPCPDKPNCVSSAATDARHKIEGFALLGDHRAEFDRLKKTVSEMPNVTVVVDSPDYMHAEFTSSIMRFVDDFEISFNEVAGRAEVRSASRLGRKDFDVNRNRIELIRAKFLAK